jgi:MerR family transcriptional regulator, light-induced transcriptional regulator
MRSLKTREAAALLSVSPNTLRTWERKFGCPQPVRSSGRHRSYRYAEIVALRDALRRGLSVPSAVSFVRDGLGADTEGLVAALDSFDLSAADRAMEASLALRSLERSVDEVLLPALDEIVRRDGLASARWAVGHRWCADWLGRAQRLTPWTEHGPGILIGDASGGHLGPAGPGMYALELLCRRGGLRVLTLPVDALAGLAEVLVVLKPLCLVVAGGHASDEEVARWVYCVRRHFGALPLAVYLRPMRSGARNLPTHVFRGAPVDAHRQLLELLAAEDHAKSADSEEPGNYFAQRG